jgi:hypothetical protein
MEPDQSPPHEARPRRVKQKPIKMKDYVMY